MGQKIYEQTGTSVTTPGLIWDGNDLIGQAGVGENDPWVFLNDIRSAAGVIYARGDDFMVDYLGSVTGITDKTSGSVTSTFRNKPYGATLSGSPSGAGFFWTGNTGSRRTGKEYAEQYNRARHYSSLIHQ